MNIIPDGEGVAVPEMPGSSPIGANIRMPDQSSSSPHLLSSGHDDIDMKIPARATWQVYVSAYGIKSGHDDFRANSDIYVISGLDPAISDRSISAPVRIILGDAAAASPPSSSPTKTGMGQTHRLLV